MTDLATAAVDFRNSRYSPKPAINNNLKEPENSAHNHFTASPFVWTDPAKIPPRDWVYGRHLIRKFVSVTIAPGGLGKSSLLLTEAIAMATGKPLLSKEIKAPQRVWLWNLEDPTDELSRRIHAICQHYKITPDNIGDRLFIDSGREQELCTAISGKNGAVIQQPVIDNLIDEISANQIDVLIVDPFISSHQIDENNNPAMDAVVKMWGRVADKTNSAIALVHHTRKQSTDGLVTADSARGAKAVVDAARDVRCLTRMTEDEGSKSGVDNHRLFFKVYSDKANLAPPADKSEWYRLENVGLENGDWVGVIEPWKWPDPFNDVTVSDLKEVQKKLHNGNFRHSVQAKDWAGYAVADILELDISEQPIKQKVKLCLAKWVDNGALKIGDFIDEKGVARPIYEVGEWV